MLVVKSNRITSLPIINKLKYQKLFSYLDQVLLTKNLISNQASKDSTFQNLLFDYLISDSSLSKSLNSYYSNFNFPLFTQWELQKFFNSDYIDKDKNRIEQFFKQYKSKIFVFKKDSYSSFSRNFRKDKPSSLSKVVTLMVKNYFFNGFLQSKIDSLFSENSFCSNNKLRIESLVNNIIHRFKYNRKPINYSTPSMIKCGQKDLGITKPRMIKDNSNSKYQYWYSFDIKSFNPKSNSYIKEVINIPLAYKESYHKDFKQYQQSLGKNKFSKGINKKSIINYDKLNKSFEVLFEREHQISLSKNTNRLTITLSKEEIFKINENEITKSNSIGIDVGGSTTNTLVDSNNNFVSFEYLNKLVEKINIVDEIEAKTSEEKKDKGRKLAKLLRVNEYFINNIIKKLLDEYSKQKINHLIFEKLDSWSVKWRKDTKLDEKHNRVFRLLRTQGLVELFKKQARNRGILVHTIPSFYTSQRCSNCGVIDKSNIKTNRLYQCKCGLKIDRDINAAKNIKYILERFSSKLCKKNSYGEYESIKYITKEFTKSILLDKKVKNFSSKSCN